MTGFDRRNALLGAGALSVGAVLTACSGSTKTGSTNTDPTKAASAEPASTSAGPSAPSGTQIDVSSVPVGGGRVFDDVKVVVTQPVAGQFHAFSAVCPHKGCTVDKVADGLIECPCHGSTFSVKDGSVEHGPATKPLASRTVTVDGSKLTVG